MAKDFFRAAKPSAQKISGAVLLAAFIFSILFALAHAAMMPADMNGSAFAKLRHGYILMTVKCLMGIIVMFIPVAVNKKQSIGIPEYMFNLYFIFLFCAIFLGDVCNIYVIIPFWDTLLHAFSGIVLAIFGFSIIDIINSGKNIKIPKGTFFVSLFVFCLALSVGTLWEIYEFTVDHLLSLNLQQYALSDGTLRMGQDALADTMKDLISEAITSLSVAVIGYIIYKRKHKDNKIDDSAADTRETVLLTK